MAKSLLWLTATLLASNVLAKIHPAGDPTISQSLYTTFHRITKYAAAAYASDCPLPPNNSTVIQYFSNSTTATQATLFRSDALAEIVIAFRGTNDAQDLTVDALQTQVPLTSVGTNCPSCLVHQGTHTAWNSVSADVLSVLQTQVSLYPTYRVIVTGHSLGGALASIASASLVHFFPGLTTYTMGQFRTGNPAYADYIDFILPEPHMYRITHTNDGVPQTIHKDSAFGIYQHHSREFWELEPFGSSATYKCDVGDDAECNASTLGLGLFGLGTAEGINPAHLCYTGVLIGNPEDMGASACNAVSSLPQDCSTATPGGIL